jgi:hypothetical protein
MKQTNTLRIEIFYVHSAGSYSFVSGQSLMPLLTQTHGQNLILSHIATPHNGSSAATLGSNIMAMLPSSVTSTSNLSLLSSVKKDSPLLQDLANAFRYVAQNLLIATFYETLKSKVGAARILVSSILVDGKFSPCLLGAYSM